MGLRWGLLALRQHEAPHEALESLANGCGPGGGPAVALIVGKVELAGEGVLKDAEEFVVGDGAVGGVGGAGVEFLEVEEQLAEVNGLCEDDGVEGVVGARVARLGERADELVILADAPSGFGGWSV